MASARTTKQGTPRKKTSSARVQGSTSTSRKSGGASQLAAGNGAGTSVLLSRIGFIAIIVCLIIFGLVMLYSASSIYSYNQYGDYTEIFNKQVIFVAVGLLLALCIALVNYHVWALPFWVVTLCATIPFLVLVLVNGDDALGARRWFDLGFTTVQPSEFTKIALMILLAHLVDRCRNNGYTPALIITMIAACVIPIGLIMLEPDLGTTIIAVIGILAVLWFGGIPKRIIMILTVGMGVLAILAVVGTGFRQTRIAAWLDPQSDPLGSGYQLLNSYYAFGEGGIFGVGLGLSKQKFNWLPQGENDFIFAIVGEELGLVGAAVVMLLFVGLVFMALRIARTAPDPLGAMIAGSCGVIIGAQAFLNMLCVVGAIPTTGKPLPFFSAGGSSIITTMMLVGLIISVSIRSSETNVYAFRREQFELVNGGGRQQGAAADVGSLLSRLPNPAAIIAGGIRPQPQSQMQIRSKRSLASSDKIIPISRGRAERSAREKEAQRQKREGYHTAGSRKQSTTPVSMASLRRNRVRRSGSGGNSA